MNNINKNNNNYLNEFQRNTTINKIILHILLYIQVIM